MWVLGLGQGSQAELVPSDPGELSQVSEGAGSQAWEVPCQLLPPLPYPARNPYLWRCLPDPPLHIPWSSTFKRIDLPVQDRPVPCSLSAFIKGYRSAISPPGEAVRDSQPHGNRELSTGGGVQALGLCSLPHQGSLSHPALHQLPDLPGPQQPSHAPSLSESPFPGTCGSAGSQ